MNEDTQTNAARTEATRIVVVGGGIGGAEAALTLALGLPDAHVTLVGRWPSIRVLPDLVYVPFGVSARRIDVPLGDLEAHGVTSVVAQVERVDVDARILSTSVGPIEFDVLVAAPGARPRERSGQSLRSLDDAQRLQRQLAELVQAARRGEHRTITIRSESDDSWTAPACELALLTGGWMRAMRVDHRVETMLATSDHDAFEWFGPIGEATVESALRRAKVQVATGVPVGRFDQLGGDVVIEFGALEPRVIDGLPGRGTSGWYEPSPTFEVAPNVFVIGDAINLPYRAGFATAWQSRQVLLALGGSTESLGIDIGGIPSHAVEYQMDLADGVMRARLEQANRLAHPFLGHDADVAVTPGARPDKLAGLLLHDRVLRHDAGDHDAALAFRDALRSGISA